MTIDEEVSVHDFDALPRRLYLDSSTIQTLDRYGEFVWENVEPAAGVRAYRVPDVLDDLEDLRFIFQVNERAMFDVVVSPAAIAEVADKQDRPYLRWAMDVASHWRERIQEYQGRAFVGRGAAPLAPPFRECVVRHSWYKGTSCDECGLDIPVGPYTSEQMTELFGSTMFVGQRRADEPAPEQLANPVTQRELDLAAEHATLTTQINELKQRLSHGDERPAIGPVQTIIDALTGRPAGNEPDDDTETKLLVAEGRWERVNRQLRAERAQRAGRMRSWVAKQRA